jgi:hypothetical protein
MIYFLMNFSPPLWQLCESRDMSSSHLYMHQIGARLIVNWMDDYTKQLNISRPNQTTFKFPPLYTKWPVHSIEMMAQQKQCLYSTAENIAPKLPVSSQKMHAKTTLLI